MTSPLSVIILGLLIIDVNCLNDNTHIGRNRTDDDAQVLNRNNPFDSYPFSLTLSEGNYYLYWNVSFTDETIQFAVRVKTTGWVGFGISSNGQMPGSDVVIGWIDGENAYFHDRFAEGRRTPPIDNMQDWFLVSSGIRDGYTELEFTRNFTTCDTEGKDLIIHPETFHVLYSWNDAKPTVTSGRDGETYSIAKHQAKGSARVNLITGGLPNEPDLPDNVQEIVLGVSNLEIPAQPYFTYWCKAYSLEDLFEDGANNSKYVIKHGAKITEGSEDYVYNILILGCNGLNKADLNPNGYNCFSQSSEVANCLRGANVAGWSVGGNDVVFPENVAQPINSDDYKFLMFVIHYDNPLGTTGIIDNSSMYFKYIEEPREHDAALLEVGHQVSERLAIPPGLNNYTTRSFCSSACTEEFLPVEGLTIISNTFHTRSAGIGVSLTLARPDDKGNYKEIASIDRNLHYYNRLQQTEYIPENKIVVKPGDALLTKCFYNTSDRDTVTFGGYSNLEEACLSFMLYYPKTDIHRCLSRPFFDEVANFSSYVPEQYREAIASIEGDYSKTNLANVLTQFEWNDSLGDAFGDAVYNGNQFSYCYHNGPQTSGTYKIPEISEYYSPPAPPRMCSRDDGSGAGFSQVSVVALLLMAVLSSLLLMYA